MRKFMLLPALAIVLGVCLQIGACAGVGGSSDPASIAQQQAALTYLQSTLTALQTAEAQAEAQNPASAAQIKAQVAPVLTQLQTSISDYQAAITANSSTGVSTTWATAESIISTAVEVLGPAAIEALVK
jgi:ribosomal protein L29